MFFNGVNGTSSNGNGASTGGAGIFTFGIFDGDHEQVKEAHDAYDLYVNGEYVGKKVLLTQTEKVNDVIDFLKVQGVQDVSAELTGDHYLIQTNDSGHVKDILNTYLNNR
ncbi:hypothetical protein [Halalkalibacter akibai]|uniref:Uncharacterized protein n=1 Tax=Halalkalibacter akibai (strain ATCC 43226 / DSM 21942 / CIP 109018 / JCM 9157 / 1139) TaxID=1236973 RepID=W4QSJ9_HALA3|nr:hypothetical protein [Halalkalibacter akibai]GAE34309.1 hypothetical protein JCM9157_1357 [Halalkalibacter akibai JCM 9157]